MWTAWHFLHNYSVLMGRFWTFESKHFKVFRSLGWTEGLLIVLQTETKVKTGEGPWQGWDFIGDFWTPDILVFHNHMRVMLPFHEGHLLKRHICGSHTARVFFYHLVSPCYCASSRQWLTSVTSFICHKITRRWAFLISMYRNRDSGSLSNFHKTPELEKSRHRIWDTQIFQKKDLKRSFLVTAATSL